MVIIKQQDNKKQTLATNTLPQCLGYATHVSNMIMNTQIIQCKTEV